MATSLSPPTYGLHLPLSALLSAVMSLLVIAGCVNKPAPTLLVKGTGMEKAYPEGTIINGRTGETVTFEAMLDELAAMQLIFVGERHNAENHHDIQLKILEALHQRHPDIMVAMEMFERSYQAVLDEWSRGELEETEFLERSHWYANWRFPYRYYRGILDYIKHNGLDLVALNLPFHIPPKIALGGIDSLSSADAAYLPERINTSDPDHRKYVEEIFARHAKFGRTNFDYFYAAQCVWEDIMAESIAGTLSDGTMVAFTGNGHIIEKFGVPNRAAALTGASMRTVYLAESGGQVDLTAGDFIWVTAPSPGRHGRGR